MSGPQDLLVLLVEDDLDTREAMMEVLAEAGYRVECAADGREAADYLEGHAIPAAIICDQMMPRMSGAELVEHLHRSETLAKIPTILLSGSAPTETPPNVRSLRKPIEMAELLEALRSAVKASES